MEKLGITRLANETNPQTNAISYGIQQVFEHSVLHTVNSKEEKIKLVRNQEAGECNQSARDGITYFFLRTAPAHSMAKPACMKNTRAALKIK